MRRAICRLEPAGVTVSKGRDAAQLFLHTRNKSMMWGEGKEEARKKYRIWSME